MKLSIVTLVSVLAAITVAAPVGKLNRDLSRCPICMLTTHLLASEEKRAPAQAYCTPGYSCTEEEGEKKREVQVEEKRVPAQAYCTPGFSCTEEEGARKREVEHVQVEEKRAPAQAYCTPGFSCTEEETDNKD